MYVYPPRGIYSDASICTSHMCLCFHFFVFMCIFIVCIFELMREKLLKRKHSECIHVSTHNFVRVYERTTERIVRTGVLCPGSSTHVALTRPRHQTPDSRRVKPSRNERTYRNVFPPAQCVTGPSGRLGTRRPHARFKRLYVFSFPAVF